MVGKVSVVIPCFNHGDMLREALESVEQVRTASLGEVIIVNDGSTDPDTRRYLEELSQSNYKIIHQPNQGLGAARNTGIHAANGEFILPLDNDNRLRKPYLTQGVTLLNKNPNVGVIHGDAWLFGEKSGRWQVAAFDLYKIAKYNYIDACALYRKSMWESLNGYDAAMPWMGWEDWDFWLRAAIHGWDFIHLEEIAFDYRVRKGSMLDTNGTRHSEVESYVLRKSETQVLKLLEQQGPESLDSFYLQHGLGRSVNYRNAFSKLVRRLQRIQQSGRHSRLPFKSPT